MQPTTAVVHGPDDGPFGPPPPHPTPEPAPKGAATVRLGDLMTDPRYPHNLYQILDLSGLPAVYATDHRLWLIHRHPDVKAALTDNVRWSNALTLMPVAGLCPEAADILAELGKTCPPTTAAADNPVHARTRKALRATFPNTPERVAEQYGPTVDFRVDQLTTLIAASRFHVVDLAAEFANRLPLWVICDLLGVGGEDITLIRAWADGQIALVWGQPEPAEQVRLAQGLLDFWQFTRCHILRREDLRVLGDVADDWTGRILRYRDGRDDVLTLDEVASLAFNLLVAGHETTAGLLTHAIDAALSVPGKWRAMHNDPDLIPGHVEQVLRRRPPIDAWLRYTLTDINLGAVTIPSASRALLLIGAANRDPDGETLSFGKGPHYCVGAALARLEATTALRALTQRLPGLRLKPGWQRRYQPNVAFRTHTDLLAVVA